MLDKNTIILTLHYQGNSTRVQTNSKQYYSLMTLISENLFVPGFGLCCGMGGCGTCLVQLSDSYNSVKRNVLACDIRVDDNIANADVFIPDKVY